jgi:para-aminobenzoate synthetase component I
MAPLVPEHHPAGFPGEDLFSRWPENRPLTAVVWGATGWSYFAEPVAVFRCRLCKGSFISEWVDPLAGCSVEPPVALVGRPLEDLEGVLSWAREGRGPCRSGPFAGGWIGYFAYELGHAIEPASRVGAAKMDEGWPLIELHYCPEGFVVDHATGAAVWVGDAGRRPSLDGAGDGEAEAGLADSAANEQGYMASVARIIEHIRAGDAYQVNLAHRLSGRFSGRMRSAFGAMAREARPWYGAYIEPAPEVEGGERRGVLSMSPELFLDIEPRQSGEVRITTRPMKGTRPGSGDARELRDCEKDRAELTMIVDLMRNDLGRVCRAGSVRVTEPRRIERHGPARGGVLQATATVEGVLRDGVGMADVLRATFPPGSVTGAPKIRAMQIIDELEPVQRGPYCGAIGWIGFDGRVSLNVGIRTALVRGRAGGARDEVLEGELSYSVGAGIVADSDPGCEWRETLDKAGMLNHGGPRRGTEGDAGKWPSRTVAE